MKLTSEFGINVFVMKPDFVTRGLRTLVCRRLRDGGFSILASRRKRLSRSEVAYWYQLEFERDFPLGAADPRAQPHIDYLVSGDCWALLVQHKSLLGASLFDFSRQVRGTHYLPRECEPGSLRFDLRDPNLNSIEYVTIDNLYFEPIPRNGIHCATSEVELAKCINIFFSDLWVGGIFNTQSHITSCGAPLQMNSKGLSM